MKRRQVKLTQPGDLQPWIILLPPGGWSLLFARQDFLGLQNSEAGPLGPEFALGAKGGAFPKTLSSARNWHFAEFVCPRPPYL